jgi:hypothetical protein
MTIEISSTVGVLKIGHIRTTKHTDHVQKHITEIPTIVDPVDLG